MLAKMGALLELKADLPKSETLHDLKQLATARQGLIKDRTAAKARLAATTHELLAHSDVSGQRFQRHPDGHSGVSGQADASPLSLGF